MTERFNLTELLGLRNPSDYTQAIKQLQAERVEREKAVIGEAAGLLWNVQFPNQSLDDVSSSYRKTAEENLVKFSRDNDASPESLLEILKAIVAFGGIRTRKLLSGADKS